MKTMERGIFSTVLTFEKDKETGIKTAVFTDKFNKESKVITSWNGVVPGLRYYCLLKKATEEEKKRFGDYKMQKCRVWVDDLQVRRKDDVVDIYLDNAPILALRFDAAEGLDYESRIEELGEYFTAKSLQLAGSRDIEKFMGVYRDTCKQIYDERKKELKKEGRQKYEGKKIKG